MKKGDHTPEWRAAMSAYMRALWADPDYRARQAARLRALAPHARAVRLARPRLPPAERKIRAKVTHEQWRARRDEAGLPS
jgi:hypothetical protein